MKKGFQRGATLIEFIIAFVIVGVLVGVVFSSCGAVTVPMARANAEKYARSFTRRFYGWTAPVVDCMGSDNDHNGYVTCTVAERPGTPTRQLECAHNVWIENNRTCRDPRVMNVQNPQ